MATLGLLLLSSGIALMVAATPADASTAMRDCRSSAPLGTAPDGATPAHCPPPKSEHATADVDWIEPTCDNGNQAGYDTSGDHVTWSVVLGSASPGSWITLKATAVAPYEFSSWPHDAHYFIHHFHKAEDDCTEDDATARITWIEPSCENQNTAGWTPEGEHVTFAITDGQVGPGETVEITATADQGHSFDEHKTTKVFTHTFDDPEDCTVFDATADITWTEPDCENQNTPAFTPVGEHVTFEITDGSVAPGASVEVTATADEGHAFENESTTAVFTHTFDPAEICEIVLPPDVLTPTDPTFVDPTCTTDPSMGLPQAAPPVEEIRAPERAAAGPAIQTSDADGIHYVATGDLVAGGTVEVDATLIDPEKTQFAESATTHWTHTFAVPAGCTSVSPPVVDNTSDQTDTVTPTVVEAGLAGAAVQDARAQQGLTLIVAGLALLIGAGSLGLRRGRSRA